MAGLTYSGRKKKNSGLLWGILAVVLVVVMIKWGIPLFVNILAGPAEQNGNALASVEDNVPPQIPILSPLPEATNSANLLVEGFTEADVEVNLFRNDELLVNDRSDQTGNFRLNLKLADGENRIQVKARDKAANESQSVVKKVIFDKKSAEIIMESPTDGTEIFGKKNQDVPFSGKVSKTDSAVTVNGNYARVDSDGKFSVIVRLSEGDNNVRVKATDRAGNTVEKTVRVKLTF